LGKLQHGFSMRTWRLILLPMADWMSSVLYPYTISKNSYAILRPSSTSYRSRQRRKRVWSTIVSSTTGWWVMWHRNPKYWKNQPSSRAQSCKIASWLGDSVLYWCHRLVEWATALELAPFQTSKSSSTTKSNATSSRYSHSKNSTTMLMHIVGRPRNDARDRTHMDPNRNPQAPDKTSIGPRSRRKMAWGISALRWKMLSIGNIYRLSANPIIELGIVYALSMYPTLIHIMFCL